MNSIALSSARVSASSIAAFPACVGFYFAARLALTYLLFQSEPRSGAAASVALNLCMLLATAFYTFGSVEWRVRALIQIRSVRWVCAFLAVSFVSLLWSETVSIPVALAYWMGMAADVLMVGLLVRSRSAWHFDIALMHGFVLGAALIAAIAWLSPSMQDLRPGDDEFFSPNAIGFTCAMGVFFAQYLRRTLGGYRLVVPFLAISLVRSLSKTTIAAFLVGQFVILITDKSMSRKNKVLLTLSAGFVALLFSGLFLTYYNIYTNTGNQAETLTGRIGIWSLVLERSMERPWLGHGFHGFRNVIPPFGTFEAWHAHNEVIQQFYAYGVVGLTLLVGIYGSFYRRARLLSSVAHRAVSIGLITFILVRGLGDTERFDLSFPMWAVLLLSLFFERGEREGWTQQGSEV